MRPTSSGLAALVVLIALGPAGCDLRLAAQGDYSCTQGDPSTCPTGWLCEVRGGTGAYRCYRDKGGHCTDGILDPGEVCDEDNFGGMSCRDVASPGVGNYYSGVLQCPSTCDSIDTSQCTDYCGDGKRNGPELCDGADHGAATCQAFGYYEGTLTCLADCSDFDLSGCSGYCGDGIVNGGEFCDGRDQQGDSCTSYSRYSSGSLGCDSRCRRNSETCVETWRPMVIDSMPRLIGVWGTSATDVFAVGDAGTIVRYDGVAWKPMTSGTTGFLTRVWGSSATNVFAVGEAGTILHYDGVAWKPMATQSSETLYGV